jgi:GT2 family glycosyltransferase
MLRCLNNKLISFIVPLFNHVEQTREMLASLKASLPHDLRYEVIFADDGSTDETRSWLASLEDERVQFILNERNYGYAKTNNLAAQQAKGDILGLLNNDLLFESGWFEPMLAALEATGLGAGIVGNVQHRVIDRGLDHAGVVLTPRGQFDHVRVEPSEALQAIPVYVTTGACMLMRRSDFEEVGGFDETFVNGCEDIDLCLKIRQLGKKIYVAPNSRILHHVSLSRSRVSLQNEKNSQYLYSKWRTEIKLQLTKCWVKLLTQADGDYVSYLDGELTHSFKSQPHIAAMTIAEAALQREEARWAKELDTPTANNNWHSHVTVRGLHTVPKVGGYLASNEIEVNIEQLKTACNFYVCGRLLEDFDPHQIGITISVNSSQEKALRLEKGHVVNVGVINPLVSPTGRNTFRFNVYFMNAEGEPIGPASSTMLISHFVVDDQVIRDFSI